jgi:AraC family transcriptional regulator
MTMLERGGEKYDRVHNRKNQCLTSRRWFGLLAELRNHGETYIPDFVQPATEIVLMVRGALTVERQAMGNTQRTQGRPGALWLCPAGVPVTFFRASSCVDAHAVHIYLAPELFGFGERDLLYRGGVQDVLVEQIGRAILSEMWEETAAGSLLVDALSRSLAARLLHSHSRTRPASSNRLRVNGGLDRRRLARVMEFIEANLRGDLSIDRMADVAHLSPAHFARAFRQSTGRTPHQFVSAQRLDLAKRLLVTNQLPISEIALAVGFSSHASFTRAFYRAVGAAPSRYGAMAASSDRRSPSESDKQ